MNKTLRKVHLLGSMPFGDEEHAMTHALEMLGNDIMSFPDVGIGKKSEVNFETNRAAWVQAIISSKENQNDWEVVNQPSRNENDLTGIRLAPKQSPSVILEHLNFHWLSEFKSNFPIFKSLREKHEIRELRYQVDLPTGLGITFKMMKSPLDAFRYAAAFNKRMAYEANEMLKIASAKDIIYQIEAPGEYSLIHQLPKYLVDLSLYTIIGLVKRLNPVVPIGIHLSAGDLNDEGLEKPKNLDKMVRFANRLISKWPETHQLDYLHFPLAETIDPPTLDQDYYKALGEVKLPEGVRFVAGFVHEKSSEEELSKILKVIEGIRGHKVDVASSYGMSQCSTEMADHLLSLSRNLIQN